MLWINYFWTLPWKKLWSTSQIWWQKCFKQGYKCFYGHWHEVKLGPEANLTSFWKPRKPNCYFGMFWNKKFRQVVTYGKEILNDPFHYDKVAMKNIPGGHMTSRESQGGGPKWPNCNFENNDRSCKANSWSHFGVFHRSADRQIWVSHGYNILIF